ncbi:hypothetical protein ACFL52_01070 [Candidatus Margulisiibacteriota bacterium]
MRNVLLCLFFCVLSVGSVSAYSFPMPTMNGSSGLARIPDATVIPYKNWNLSLDYGTKYVAGGNPENVPSMYYKANLGTFQNFELGLVGGYNNAGTDIREGVFINLKYSPNIGDGTDPLLLAIGVENLSSKTQTGLYMVATKPFRQGPKLSFGFLADFPGNRFRPLGMAGLDIPVGTLSILMDLFAGETVFQFNAGLRYFLFPTFALELRGVNILGDTNNAQAAKDPKQILIGFSWANPF